MAFARTAGRSDAGGFEIFEQGKAVGKERDQLKVLVSTRTSERDAVQNLSLKALYLPDQKRILLDQDLPLLKHRWNEAHEIGHDIIPWHTGMMLGDTEQTLTPACHQIMEAEANYAARFSWQEKQARRPAPGCAFSACAAACAR